MIDTSHFTQTALKLIGSAAGLIDNERTGPAAARGLVFY